MSNFDYAVQHTLELEGVFSDYPNDPGGKTKYGITEKLWVNYCRDLEIRPIPPIEQLSLGVARKVYRDVFWDGLRLDRLRDKHVAAEVFDSAVNVGPSDGVKFLQMACNYLRLPGWDLLKVDGVLGPFTRGCVHELLSRRYRIEILKAQNGFQFMHYVEQDNPNFSRGWLKRVQLAVEDQ